MFKQIVIILFLMCICFQNVLSQDDLNIIEGKWLEYSDAGNSLYRHFTKTAYEQLKNRKDKIMQIGSLAEWKSRQDYVRKALNDCIGGFPQKSPLNARITRTVQKDKFRIEHIIYESVPGFYVTSSLFLPANVKKGSRLPVIIYCSGHSVDGYRSEAYQVVILNLVRKGFIVFAFDPVGQGERLEYYDSDTGKSAIGGPTSEHSYPGAQALLTGSSQAMYMIWDGIRAVDYLLTRKEVDPERIGITGRSGGGTQSAYIAAYDDRIYAAAPENYITNYTRLLQTIGPQDAEQNLTHVVSEGLDHPDFLIVRAPKPALMVTTSNDMFNIQGAMETEQEVSRVYKAYGKPGNFSRCEDYAGHASTRKNRETLYAFFQEHLKNPGNPYDEAVDILSPEDLRVTESGQVSVSLHGETVFSLTMKKAMELEKKMDQNRQNPDKFLNDVSKAAAELSGYREPTENSLPVLSGRIRRDNYTIEKYLLKGEGDYILPYLLFRPDAVNGKAMVWLNPDGKAANAKAGEEIESFVDKGYTVLSADLPGTGELSHGALRGDAYFSGASHNLWYASIITGRSITGVRAGDIVRLANTLAALGFNDITGYAKSYLAPDLLHAALLSDKFRSLVLSGPYSSYFSIATHRFYNPFYILSCVPGTQGSYDIPDLEAAFAPRKLIIEGAVDCLGTRTYIESIRKDLDVIKRGYASRNAADKLKISDIPLNINEIIDFLK
jgi:hypothetical protein